MLEIYEPVYQSYLKIAGLHPWNLLLTGSQETEAEPRCRETIEKISIHLTANCQHIRIARQPGKGMAGKFLFSGTGKAEEASAQDFYKGFEKITEQVLGENAVSVLMDITSLELDTILHLQNLFSQLTNVQNLFALYSSPEKYINRDQYKLRLNEIAQPPGYISLRMDNSSSYPHVFILGFDEGRALRFLELFDEWKDHEKYAIIIDPSYMPDGATEAKKANSWIKDLKDDQIFPISGFEPLKICEKLKELYRSKNRLDIIPLGPKLMLLGATRFYFSLDETERNQVRILYDFPQTTAGDSEGISKHYLFNCLP